MRLPSTCSARSCHDSRCRKRADFPHAGLFEHSRACIERGARRADVVYQDHDRPFEPAFLHWRWGPTPAPQRGCRAGGPGMAGGAPEVNRKSSTDVSVTARGRKFSLRPRSAVTAEGRADWHAQVAREVGGLVESALSPPRRVERHRNRPIGARQHIGAADAHQFGQRLSQCSPPFIFERVHDRAQRAVVLADGTRAIHLPVAAPAARTSRQRHADRPPGRQRIAAAVADRRCQRKNRSPAGRTDRPRRRMFEKLPAGRAGGREKDGEDGVGDTPKCRNAGMHECKNARTGLCASVHSCILALLHQPAEISIRSAFPHRRSRP